MERKITFVQYGCGRMSRYLMRYAMGMGCELKAAFDSYPPIIGKDVGSIIGDGHPDVGVAVTDAAAAGEVIQQIHPDVCIIATRSTVAEIEDILTICARNGVNAITTCEEALFPWNSSPEAAKRLDQLAKEGGCTLAGSGFTDLYLGPMVTLIAGSQFKIEKIYANCVYNINDYGIALAEAHGLGLSVAEFEQKFGQYNQLSSEAFRAGIEGGSIIPSYMWNQNGWICSRLGLTVVSQIQQCIPTKCEDDLYSHTLERLITAGSPTGMCARVVTETAEGIVVETECVGKVYAPGETDRTEIVFHGTPGVSVTVTEPPKTLTNAIIVNRIPQLIDAPAGYITTDQLPYNEYHTKPLHEYVTSK